MKTTLILLAVSITALTSCSTMYKTGQTPDDVYYSPVRTIPGGDVATNRDETPAQPIDNYDYYRSGDRAIRMGITDYRYRSLYNDYSYGYGSPYDFSLSYGHGYYNNIYSNNYYGNNYNSPYYSDLYYGSYYYNPYYNAYPVYVLPASPLKNTTPRTTNLNGYGHTYNNSNSANLLTPLPTPVRGYNNSNGTPTGRTSGLGNILNKVLVPATNNSNTQQQQPTTTRTYTPAPASTPSSSSSSSSSSGGGRIPRPQ